MPSTYCANDFDEYVTVQRLIQSDDGFGGKTSSWVDRTGLWCKVIDKSGGEGELNGRIEATESIECITHFRDDLDSTDRLLLDGVYYDVKRLENVNRKRRYLKIYADSQVTE